ncbi:MAG TPA: hypothetical protein VIW67_02245 [Terriglobales bacterium]|jgi:hypothetical protein
MNSQEFSEWLAALSLPARINALARIYLRLTVNARELFMPDWTTKKEQRVLEILHGLNEIHHTLANQLTAYSADEQKARSIQALSQILLEIENRYHLDNFLTPAIELARSSNSPSPLTVYPDGAIADGNTRIAILKERGVDVDNLPRVERIRGI